MSRFYRRDVIWKDAGDITRLLSWRTVGEILACSWYQKYLSLLLSIWCTLFQDTGNHINVQLSLFELAAKKLGAKLMAQPYAGGSGS